MPLFRRSKKAQSPVRSSEGPSTPPPADEGPLSGLYDPPNAVSYVVREPWSWVMNRVMADLESSSQFLMPSELPSKDFTSDISPRRRNVKLPKACTLRFEVQDSNQNFLVAAHSISEAFDGLEDKDELVRTMQRCRCEHLELSPKSLLLNWDVTKDECKNLVGEELPSLLSNADKKNGRVAVLKEPMGSKGVGVFFVRNVDEIHDIIEEHRKKAVDEPNFLDNLIDMKGRIPSWVLQAEVFPCMLMNDGRKFHVRTYVAAVEHLESDDFLRTYVYAGHEVRIARKAVPSDETAARDRDAHITYGTESKSSDMILLKDAKELTEKNLQPKIEAFVAKVFAKHVAPDMERRVGYSASQDDGRLGPIQKFAIAALDLMITSDERIYLLEVNVNPGAPPEDATTDKFQDHLVQLMADLIDLAVGRPSPRFLPTSKLI